MWPAAALATIAFTLLRIPWAAPVVTVGVAPIAATVDPATNTIYVSNLGDNTISVVDGSQCDASNTSRCVPIATMTNVGFGPHYSALDPTTHTLYVANAFTESGDDGNAVQVLDISRCNGWLRATLMWQWKGDLSALEHLCPPPENTRERLFHVWFETQLNLHRSDAAEELVRNDSREMMPTDLTLVPKSCLLGYLYAAKKDPKKAREYFEAALPIVERAVAQSPLKAEEHVELAGVYAQLGRKEDAVREGRRACDLLPESKSALAGLGLPIELARIYLEVGEMELGLPLLEHSLATPGGAHVRQLRTSISWEPFRNEPRFQQLLAKYAGVLFVNVCAAGSFDFSWSNNAMRCPFRYYLLLALTAFSNTQAQDATAERLIITGSAIPSAEEVGPNPVETIDRDYIEKSGERTTEQLLRNLPLANANGVPSGNNANGFAPGAASISLRGFDASATLVLIDGRRVAPYPVGTGDFGTQSFIDLNSIPADAIERIEILKDGASTTYGADAVAGVVNIKLRHDYHGAEASLEYGNTLDKDSSEFRASLIAGAGDGDTNVMAGMSYYHRNAIFDRDRGFSNRATLLSSNSSPGNFQLSRDAVLAAGVSPALLPDSDLFYASPPPFTNGLVSPNDYRYSTRRISFFNFDAFSSALPESERYGGFVNFDHKVAGDQLVTYGDLLYQNVRTENQLAPSPTGPFESPGHVPIAIPPHAPGDTLGGPTYEETGVPFGAYNPFNPFQQIISGSSRFRLAEFPNRVILDTTEAFLSTLGVRGDKLFDGSWGYDGALRYSEVRDTATGTFVSDDRLNRILSSRSDLQSQFAGVYRQDGGLQSVW